ncbi:MAG: hypothetical protein C0524_02185 [Rhodobacter sp.]|nr:hypothetical protein [Rhodobacter sp.]
MPNAFAYFMLISWPVVTLALFRVLPLQNAVVWSLLGGYLILPSATVIDLPVLPNLDKTMVSSLSTLALSMIYASKAGLARDWAGKSGRLVIVALTGLLIATPLVTVLQNSEPIISGPRFIPGLGLYDAISTIVAVMISIVPFWIGLRYLNTREAHKTLLKAFVFGALIYSLPALAEVRLSPQLHTWVYGFFPHDFAQHIRAGGFRPIVFLSHGLMLGIFLCMALVSALTLWREALRDGQIASGWLIAAIWLAIILFVSKNLAALGIAAVLSTLAVFTGRRVQTTFAMVVAAVVVFYPMLRGAGMIPVDAVYEFAKSVDEERAESLKFRLENEDALLEHANKKPLFGWGSWGRNQLYDPDTGKMVSVTDGAWVILIGTYGWLGYVAHFGLLTLPIVFYVIRHNKFGPSLITPGLMLVLSATLIDQIPNAGLVSYVWLIAGGLTGYVLWRPDVAAQEPGWVMAGKGATRRRRRTARQRASE